MVFGQFPFEEWATEAGLLGQVAIPSHGRPSRHLFSAFTADDAKPRSVCPPGKDHCFCTEGHKCIQSWSKGPNAAGADFVDYIEGCPADADGNGWISPFQFNKNNPLCADDKCTCVLKQEPNVDGPQFTMIPSLKGKWRLVKNRYEMPKSLTDKFVNAVRGGEEENEGGAKEPVWLTGDEWVKEYPEVKANMNRIMRTMHRKLIAIESMFEEPKSYEDEGKEDPTLGPKPPDAAVPETPPVITAMDDQGERAAKLIMTEFRMFQQMCRRLQTSAQALGQADDGEGGLNCFDDYKERVRLEDVEKSLEQLGQVATPGQAEFLNTLKMPAKEHGTRNLLVVMGLVRDMGPDETSAFWLPRPPSAHPPILPSSPKPPLPLDEQAEANANKEEPSEEEGGTSSQSMAIDVKAAAAMTGWASRPASRRPSRHPRQACSKRTAEGSVFL